MIITLNNVLDFKEHLILQEKSAHTIAKYVRDAGTFLIYANQKDITKELVIDYKNHLIRNTPNVGSVNSIISSINSFLKFLNLPECKVNVIQVQQEIYKSEERELTEDEYFRLLKAAEPNYRLWVIIQTIASTGIRVSELRFITVKDIEKGEFNVICKRKKRKVMMPDDLREILTVYIKEEKITSGMVFRTRSGKPIDRKNIWKSMKSLCQKAGVNPKKVFPHNLRKLFAVTFYRQQKDIAKLADVLGHKSIVTTRIYIMTSGAEHRRIINSLKLTTIPHYNNNGVNGRLRLPSC